MLSGGHSITILWEIDGTETQLITADDIDMRSKALLNVSNIETADLKITYTDSSLSFDEINPTGTTKITELSFLGVQGGRDYNIGSIKNCILIRGADEDPYIRLTNSASDGFAQIKYIRATDILYFESAASYQFDANVHFIGNITLSGTVDGIDIATDVAANTAASHAQSHTIVSHSDTTATGAELDTLTGGGETNLHSHAGGAGAIFVASGALVFDGNSPGQTFTDLDLSGTVGSNAALVMLSFKTPADANATAIRPKGGYNTWSATLDANAYGLALGHQDNAAVLVLQTVTDSSGIIQWKTETVVAMEIHLMMYIK